MTSLYNSRFDCKRPAWAARRAMLITVTQQLRFLTYLAVRQHADPFSLRKRVM